MASASSSSPASASAAASAASASMQQLGDILRGLGPGCHSYSYPDTNVIDSAIQCDDFSFEIFEKKSNGKAPGFFTFATDLFYLTGNESWCIKWYGSTVAFNVVGYDGLSVVNEGMHACEAFERRVENLGAVDGVYICMSFSWQNVVVGGMKMFLPAKSKIRYSVACTEVGIYLVSITPQFGVPFRFKTSVAADAKIKMLGTRIVNWFFVA